MLGNQRNNQSLQPPSSGISSLGLHPYAGKASYVGGLSDNNGNRDTAIGTNSSNVAVVRPQQQHQSGNITPAIEGANNTMRPNQLLPAQRPENRGWFNLFGVIDTQKLRNLCGGGILQSYRRIVLFI